MSQEHFITKEEAARVSYLKRAGFLRHLSLGPGNRILVGCSDGDIDARRFHRKLSVRHHPKSDFGGPLLLAQTGFRGYTEEDARSFLKNISWGIEAKDTLDFSALFHWPCGVGEKFGHTMEDVFRMVPEVLKVLYDNEFFQAETVVPLFHVKRINRAGNPEENMYVVYLPEYHIHFGGSQLIFR